MIASADLAACRVLLANGSRTFLAASWLLPRDVRDAACALYAFCRLADDLVDEDADEEVDGDASHRPARAVEALRLRLDAIYAGTPHDQPADRAFAAVVRRYRIDRALPAALIDGFAWDAAGRRYETLDALHGYAARVAGSVGAMMALLMGARDADALARACDLGVAMQLSNIARDVGDDARLGRLYLPLAWMRDAGLDPDGWLARPVHDAALASVVARVLAEADRLYARVGGAIARLPRGCRPGINAARHLYAAIGHEVRRRDCDAVSGRAVVSASRKSGLLAMATVGALLPLRSSGASPPPPLSATQFLVDAAADRSVASVHRSRRGPRDRAAWTLELFERLERQDRRSRHGQASGSAA